jgi:hypothetical protein
VKIVIIERKEFYLKSRKGSFKNSNQNAYFCGADLELGHLSWKSLIRDTVRALGLALLTIDM